MRHDADVARVLELWVAYHENLESLS